MADAPPTAAAVHPSEIWATVNGMVNGFLAMLPLLAAGLVVFLIFWAIASGVRRGVEGVAKRRSEFPSAATAFGRLAYIAIMLLGLLVAVTVAFPSMTPAKLFSVLGVGGVAIGFAFKDIFQNLLAVSCCSFATPSAPAMKSPAAASPARWNRSRPARPSSAPMTGGGSSCRTA